MADIVSDIKNFPISNIISRYCRLNNCGAGRKKSCCPFHHEKTPSFYVNDSEGYFHCFGCNEGGDVISFVQKKHSCDFIQAIDILCGYLGIDKSKYQSKDIQYVQRQSSFYQTMSVINNYFIETLKYDIEAKNYVLKIRNLSIDTIKTFGIGLVKNNIAELISYCKKNNIEEKDIINTGVIKNKHTASSFDDDKYLFFRNRIMIPIHNTNGKIVAFGGRIYKNDDKTAKYLNSSENDFFKKGQILFNLHRAKMNLNKDNSLIVVEGYMDTITLWQNAFKTAIAPLGTSITETHLKTIINFCKTPIFIFDSDVAGQKAAIRCCEMLFPILQTGIIPKFLTLQSAKDCDEFLNKFSKESLKRQIDNAIEINEFLFQQKIKKYNVKNPNQKAQFQKEINFFLNEIKDPILKQNYDKFFKNELWKITNINSYNRSKNLNGADISNIKIQFYSNNLDFIEKQIISFLLENRYLLENEDINTNILPKFSKKNQSILSTFLKDNSLNDNNNKSENEFIKRYSINIDSVYKKHNIENIMKSLCITWKIQFIKNSNLDQKLKDIEIKKLIDSKKKLLFLEGDNN